MKDKLKDILLANVNLKGIAVGLIDQVIDEALTDLVNDSSTPLDNIVKDAIFPILREKLLQKIDELLAELQN